MYVEIPFSSPSIVLLLFPLMFPQTTVCTASIHTLPSVGTSVQVIVLWLVLVGQLPQFDARMLYWIAGQSGATGFQTKVSCREPRLARTIDNPSGG